MSRVISKYRYYCQTEQQYKYVWSESIPENCITDPTHQIDLQSLTIVDRVKENKVEVTDNSTYTKGNYMIQGFNQDIPVTSETSFEIKFPFNTTVYCVGLQASSDVVQDIVSCSAGGLITIGMLTNIAQAGSTELHISPSVISLLDIGVVIYAGSIKLGRICAINTPFNTINIESPLISDIDTNTPISFKKMLLDNYKVAITGVHEFGKNKIGGQNLPANTPLEITYKNQSGTEKSVAFNIEYTY